MYYHPLIGVTIFIISILLSFILGHYLMRNKKNKMIKLTKIEKNNITKGEVPSPDAPWLKNK